MIARIVNEVQEFVRSLRGLHCWYVSFGGAAGSTFELALGAKVRRHVPVQNLAHPAEFREFEGEANLLVWCPWRLDDAEGPVTSSDDTAEGIALHLPRLTNDRVRAASVLNPAGDLTISFWKGLKLHVFCAHVPGDPSFDGNWDLCKVERALYVGPGRLVKFESRHVSPLPVTAKAQDHSVTP